MPSRDVFGLERSGLGSFLFAAIGTEADGSRLTVLSALARLDEDPWAKAALWAGMPKAVSTEALAATIAQMPVTAEDQLAAAHTAARLVQLLSPSATPTTQTQAAKRAITLAWGKPGSVGVSPRRRPILMLAIGICLAMLLGTAVLAVWHGVGMQ